MNNVDLKCIDLKSRFGDRYRIVHEDSGIKSRAHDPWLQTIPCQLGHIYVHGQTALGASTDRRGSTATRLAALPCVTLVQDGDDVINVVFNADDFDKVAAVMKPKRRRTFTPEQITARTEHLRKHYFAPRATAILTSA
jgi:hypothetical protein